MRTIFAAALAALALAAPAGADEKEAKAVVERAIKAHGGAAALDKAHQLKRTDSGTQVLLNRDVPFVSEVTRSLPDRVRLQIEFDKRVSSVVVVDDKKGWQSEAGAAAVALPANRVRELREEMYVWYVATLTPLTRSGFRLGTFDGGKIDGEEAVGVKVVRGGNADARLFFLKRNGMLVKIERRVTEGGVDVKKEYLYGGFKDFGGAWLPTKETVKVNDAKFTEFTITGYSFPDKLGAGTFARP